MQWLLKAFASLESTATLWAWAGDPKGGFEQVELGGLHVRLQVRRFTDVSQYLLSKYGLRSVASFGASRLEAIAIINSVSRTGGHVATAPQDLLPSLPFESRRALAEREILQPSTEDLARSRPKRGCPSKSRDTIKKPKESTV